ncbi:MAG: ATP-binding protein [Ilumatobacteraceae bacterium]
MNTTSPTLNRQYAGDPTSLRATRRDVVDFLTECGADKHTVEGASLIASELASNAVQAGPGHPYELRIRLVDPNAASLSIRNHTTGTVPPPPANWRPVDDLAVRGRGLSIVESLADEVSVEVDGDDVTVTAWFRLISS